ncbi:MAG TPA: WbqC family protein [Candidatus Latescibacteria bacterium]|nr:WbqC family protein [Candidatus Latescibacterota bacterium]
MIVSIRQPQFMPWLGYFDKMDQADHFILLDSVPFKKNEWQNRNRIKTAQGAQWLTVPVSYDFPARIDEVLANGSVNWPHKHWQTLKTNYGPAARWDDESTSLKELYDTPFATLVDVNMATIEWLKSRLGISTPMTRSSLSMVNDEPTKRLIDLCIEQGATAYLSGPDGEKYLDVSRFTDQGVDVIFHQYEHPEYEQLFGDYISHLTCLDLILNHGDASLDIVRSGRRDGSLPGAKRERPDEHSGHRRPSR